MTLWAARFNEERMDEDDDRAREVEVLVVVEADTAAEAAELSGLDVASMTEATDADLIAWDERTDEPLTRREAILLVNLARSAQRRMAKSRRRAVERGRMRDNERERWRARKYAEIIGKLEARFDLAEEEA